MEGILDFICFAKYVNPKRPEALEASDIPSVLRCSSGGELEAGQTGVMMRGS